MSKSNKERGKLIRKQILRDVIHHPRDITKHISSIFGITPQAVGNHLKRLEEDGWLSTTGKGKGKIYTLGDLRRNSYLFELSEGFTEDKAWRDHFSFIFDGLSENVSYICNYGFTEIVNNAIDHSDGKSVYISVTRDDEDINICVIDDGEGIFKRIRRLCHLEDERQSLLELSKGKLTTDPENHTGEGVFFTSRAFDSFVIDSKGLHFNHDESRENDFLLPSDIQGDDVGTYVLMSIKRDSQRDLGTIFDEYSSGPSEFQFNKTVIPIKLAAYDNENLVSRSQAKRVLARVENFTNIMFDFDGVSSIGQGFADEIFRVYANKNPELKLIPINTNDGVKKMINRALGR